MNRRLVYLVLSSYFVRNSIFCTVFLQIANLLLFPQKYYSLQLGQNHNKMPWPQRLFCAIISHTSKCDVRLQMHPFRIDMPNARVLIMSSRSNFPFGGEIFDKVTKALYKNHRAMLVRCDLTQIIFCNELTALCNK